MLSLIQDAIGYAAPSPRQQPERQFADVLPEHAAGHDNMATTILEGLAADPTNHHQESGESALPSSSHAAISTSRQFMTSHPRPLTKTSQPPQPPPLHENLLPYSSPCSSRRLPMPMIKCQVMLCTWSNPASLAAECVPPIQRLYDAMSRKGFQWPTCDLAGARYAQAIHE